MSDFSPRKNLKAKTQKNSAQRKGLDGFYFSKREVLLDERYEKVNINPELRTYLYICRQTDRKNYSNFLPISKSMNDTNKKWSHD